MKLLLDTHVLLWWLGAPEELSEAAREAIAFDGNVVFVSAVTIWEVTLKRALGKLTIADDWFQVLADESFEELPVGWADASALAALPHHHWDPFDRLLIAQARVYGLTMVTRDEQIGRYDIPLIRA